MSTNSEMVNRLAFVGNLPPDATQEEMKQLCSQVGEVILFRFIINYLLHPCAQSYHIHLIVIEIIIPQNCV